MTAHGEPLRALLLALTLLLPLLAVLPPTSAGEWCGHMTWCGFPDDEPGSPTYPATQQGEAAWFFTCEIADGILHEGPWAICREIQCP